MEKSPNKIKAEEISKQNQKQKKIGLFQIDSYPS